MHPGAPAVPWIYCPIQQLTQCPVSSGSPNACSEARTVGGSCRFIPSVGVIRERLARRECIAVMGGLQVPQRLRVAKGGARAVVMAYQ